MKPWKNVFAAETCAVLLLAGVLVYLFIVPPSIGVADNGDFFRIMQASGLEYAGDTSTMTYYFDYIQPLYRLAPPFTIHNSYLTTHMLVVRAAKLINYIGFSSEYFHTLSLALVYSLLFLTAVYLLVRNLKTDKKWFNAVLVAAVVFVFGDATQLVYFNSLFGEACSYVGLLLLLGTGLELLRKNYRTGPLLCFFAAALLFFGSKLQYTLLCPLLLIVALPLLRRVRKKAVCAISLGVLLVVCTTIYFVAPGQLDKDTLYNSVFYGILRDGEDTQQRLDALGLPREYAPLAGTNAYTLEPPVDTKSEEFDQKFYQTVSRGTIVKYYLTHFDELVAKMELTADLAYDNTIGMLGNFRKEDRAPTRINYAFTGYNQVKAAVFPNSFWFLFAFYLLYFVYLIWAICKDKSDTTRMRRYLLLVVLITGLIQFPLPIIGNGEADIAKQLFIFNVTFDIGLLAALYAGCKWLMGKFLKASPK